MGEMEAAKLSRIRQERLPRMLAVAAFLLATLFVLRIRRPPHAWLSLLGAVLASATYYALYRLEGYRFSLADVGSSGTIFAPILTRNAAAGFAAGIILITFGLLAIEQRRWLADVAIVYDFGLFSVLLAAAPALFTYWRHGDVVSWYLPDR
jgi:hypothetical protein